MRPELASLVKAIEAHYNFRTLDDYYLEVNPTLLTALVEYSEERNNDRDTPFYNCLAQAADAPRLSIYIIENANIKTWRAVNIISGDRIEYPACAEIISLELERRRKEITRHV